MSVSTEKEQETAVSEHKMPRDWTASFTPTKLALLIGLFLFAQYPEVFLGTHSFYARDFGLFTFPVVHYVRESIWRGEIPLWNPLNNCGIPFLAQWNTAVLYPPSLFYILLPLPWSLNYFVLGHLIFAGLGMYWLARRWTNNPFAATVAGLAYALNGLSFNCLMWTSNLAALAWLPVVILALERARAGNRRDICLAALAGAVQMLSGAPEIIAITWFLAATLWAGEWWIGNVRWPTALWRFVTVAMLVFGLSAAQLLPFFDLLAHSDRTAGPVTGAWAMPAWGIANFLVPLFHCTRATDGTFIQAEQQWTSSYYLGIAILLLAFLAAFKIRNRRTCWLAAIAGLGVMLALGQHSPFYRLLQICIPWLGIVRYPIKFVTLTAFAVPLLAALAIAHLAKPEAPNHGTPSKTPFAIGAGMIVAVFAIVLYGKLVPYPQESWRGTLGNGVSRVLLLLLAIGAIWSLRRTSAKAKGWIALGILVLLGLDSITHTPRQNPTVSNRAYGQLELGMGPLPRFGESRAMVHPRMETLLDYSSTPNPLEYYAGMRRAAHMNCNLLDDYPKTTGFYSLYLRNQVEVSSLLSGREAIPEAMLTYLGVKYLSSPVTYFEWKTREMFLPLVTAGQKAIFADKAEIRAALCSNDFNPAQTVFLEGNLQNDFIGATQAQARVTTSRISPQVIEAEVDTPSPTLMNVAQTFSRTWRAYVDGTPASLCEGNLAFQVLKIPAGKHRVRLAYRDLCWETGVVISLLTFAVCICAILWRRRGFRNEAIQTVQ